MNKRINNARSVKCSNEDNRVSRLQSNEIVQNLKDLGNNNDTKAGNTGHKDLFCNDSIGNAPNFHSFSDSDISKTPFSYIDDSYDYKYTVPNPLPTNKNVLSAPKSNLGKRRNAKINKLKDNIFYE